MESLSEFGLKLQMQSPEYGRNIISSLLLKVHKIEIFFGFDFEMCNIPLLVMSKY